ncbi:MAG: isoprenoid biosynthesis glyoxalase ElbB [Bacteroidales bacterium]
MKFAVILSGCGVYDGAEIHEAVLTLLAIARNGCSYQIFAPNVMQHHVVNHATGEVMSESRNVLVEAARIARGKIKALVEYSATDFDAIIFPGGFGVAKNLCSYAVDGTDMRVDRVVEKAIKETYAAGKPIGALCISPVLIARVLGKIEVTIGNESSTAADIARLGGTHITTGKGEVIIDKKNKIVSSPCYMLDSGITDIADGADKTIKAIIDIIRSGS